jgi:hypothetical protein
LEKIEIFEFFLLSVDGCSSKPLPRQLFKEFESSLALPHGQGLRLNGNTYRGLRADLIDPAR